MYIIFLGVFPILAIIAFLLFYARHNVKFSWTKTPSMYVAKMNWCSNLFACKKRVGGGETKVPQRRGAPEPRRLSKLDIIVSKLTFTTNSNINCDGETAAEVPKRRMSFKNIKNLKLNVKVAEANREETTVQSSEALIEAPKRRLSFKNIKNFKFNGNGSNVKVNPVQSRSETPKTSETICQDDPFPVVSVKSLAKQLDARSYNRKL